MTLRRLRIFLYAACAAALVASGWFLVVEPRPEGSEHDDLGRGDYRLTATDGSTFSQAALKGMPSAVFFGFTHCPEVCPTTLGDIGVWERSWGRTPPSCASGS